MKKIYIVFGLIALLLLALLFLPKGKTPTGNVILDGDSSEVISYSLSEVSEHNVPSDCWTSINKKIYDLTPFISKHPGGEGITKLCGIDGTDIFMNKHGGYPKAQDTLKGYYIGELN